MHLGPQISASMVLYHSGEQALDAIKCIKRSREKIALVIVDNSPKDVTSRTIAAMYENDPDVTYIANKKNCGFGAAHNQAVQHVKSKYHILINPDVTFAPELPGRMAEYLETMPEVTILSPRVMNTDGTQQYVPRRQPTVRYILGGKLGKRYKKCRAWREEYTMENVEFDGPTEIEFATGCFLMIRTHAFRALRGFDPKFFLYMEDCDLSRRAAQKCGKVVYHPDMVVTHAWARASMHSTRALMRHLRSAFKYFMKWGWEW